MRKNMGSNRVQPRLRKAGIAMASSAAILAFTAAAAQSPVDLANPLVGTAPLDDPAVIGNAPPPGEPVYSGQTRSEEHTSELQSLMRISYAVFCLKKKTKQIITS